MLEKEGFSVIFANCMYFMKMDWFLSIRPHIIIWDS